MAKRHTIDTIVSDFEIMSVLHKHTGPIGIPRIVSCSSSGLVREKVYSLMDGLTRVGLVKQSVGERSFEFELTPFGIEVFLKLRQQKSNGLKYAVLQPILVSLNGGTLTN
jgi:predicted transcriptional regulator